MRNQKQFNNTTIVLIVAIFSLMGMFLTKQFSKVMIYYDDYAYYSLSYAESYVHTGNGYTFSELIDFLKAHYVDCNGRLLYFFVWLTVYMLGGLEAVQFVAALTVLSILICFWYISLEYINIAPVHAAILICSFFGLFDVEIHRFGTFWFAAFFHYVMPLIPILLLIRCYFKIRERSCSIVEHLGIIILTFFGSFSQEQLAVTVTVLAVLLIIFEFFQKHIRIINFEIITVSIISLFIIMASPGTHERGNAYTDPVAIRVVTSISQLIRLFFGENCYVVVALFSAMTGISRALVVSDTNKKIYFWDILTIFIYIVAAIITYLNQSIWHTYAGMIVGFVLVGCMIVQVTRYYWHKQTYFMLALFYTAVLSIACLCVVPELPIRLLLPPWLLLFPLLLGGNNELFQIFGSKRINNIVLGIICIIYISFAVPNALSIYEGYSVNHEVLYYNNQILQATAEKKEYSDEPIVLKRIPDALHRVQTAQDEGFEYMTVWMNQYYGLPETTTYEFTETGAPVGNTLDTAILHYGIHKDKWVEASAELEIRSGRNGIIEIKGYYPENITRDEEIRVLVDGKLVLVTQISDACFILSIPVSAEKRVKLNIESNFEIVTKGADTRHLSWLIQEMSGK